MKTVTWLVPAVAVCLVSAGSVAAVPQDASGRQGAATTTATDPIQTRADALDARLAAAVAAKRISKARADRVRLAIGRVHTAAGHQAAVNGQLTPTELTTFGRQLDAAERQLPPA